MISILQTAAKRDETAAAWAMALADGQMSSDDEAALEQWLTDERNRAALATAVSVWEMMDSVAAAPEVLGFRASAIRNFRQANVRQWANPTSYFSRAAAAVLAVMLLSTALLYAGAPTRYATETGERQLAVLADGSQLSLDAATEVEVAMHGDRRSLTLVSGRARFKVAADPLRPFSVTVGDKMVIATGTSFSVELIGREVRVILYEGHVKVVDVAATAPMRIARPGGDVRADDLLVPGHELIATLGAFNAQVAAVNPVTSDTWEAGRLSFEDEPLARAVIRMNRYALTPVRIVDPSIGQLRISGVFAADDDGAFVEAVTAILPVVDKRRNGSIELSRRAAR